MKLGRDTNGNKLIKLAATDLGGERGFSIQTLDNVPTAHRATAEEVASSAKVRAKIAKEVESFVMRHGTPRQKLGMYALLVKYPVTGEE